MYKTLWNHLAQNKKKAPAPAVFLALLTVILCTGGYAGLIPGFFGGIFYLYRMDLRKTSADPAADSVADPEKASSDHTSLIYFHNN